MDFKLPFYIIWVGLTVFAFMVGINALMVGDLLAIPLNLFWILSTARLKHLMDGE